MADMAKCYDSARLPLLRRVLTAAGWPAAVLEPLLSAYSFQRRIRIGDAVGCFANPKAGIPAGCPLAVATLAVITWPWQVAVMRAGATAARRYVDNLTAWCRADAGPPFRLRPSGWLRPGLRTRPSLP